MGPGRESAAVAAFHREEASLVDSKKKLGQKSEESAAPQDSAQVPTWLKKQVEQELRRQGAGRGSADPKGAGRGRGKSAEATPPN